MKKIKALYVHIPFCKDICSYCNFIKMYKDEKVVDLYLTSLKSEYDALNINELNTIYIGGGTPSCLSNEQLERLLSFFDNIKLPKDYEFTIEANPESLSEEKIVILKNHRVNRVSLGVQTFNSTLAKLLNRKHDYKTVKEVVSNLNKHGLTNYSFDFIYGIPLQTKAMVKTDMERAAGLHPKHISAYSLQVEENTMLYINGYRQADDNIQREYYDFIYDYLNSNGYKRYEISNFAIPGYESKHNMTYWKNEEYYAIGVSAASYVNRVRSTNTKSITDYILGKNDKESIEITDSDYMFEELMLGLRMDKGVSLKTFEEKIGVSLVSAYKKEIDYFTGKKMLELTPTHLRTTYDGSLLLNSVLLKFMDN